MISAMCGAIPRNYDVHPAAGTDDGRQNENVCRLRELVGPPQQSGPRREPGKDHPFSQAACHEAHGGLEIGQTRLEFTGGLAGFGSVGSQPNRQVDCIDRLRLHEISIAGAQIFESAGRNGGQQVG